MFLCFTLSTTIPQIGYKNMLPLSKYEASVLASDSVSSNRRSKIFLTAHGLSPVNRRFKSHTYGERWKKGCQIEPDRMFNPIYLSKMVSVSSPPWKHNSYVRPNDIAKLEHLFNFKLFLIRYMLNGLSLIQIDD